MKKYRSIHLKFIIPVVIAVSITYATKKNSQADLTTHVDTTQNHEIGELSRAISAMAGHLKSVIISVVQAADNIASASQQINSGSLQLSQGANEQASSVEDISSSLEEMTSTVQQNAESAIQANKIAALASSNIQKSNLAVVNSNQSIKEIADKITIIGEIAFQTNILALNAAVEAARAGEHGRGFAVVASEVRKLAERSRSAAGKIDQLSKNGVEIAETASSQFELVVPEIDHTSKLLQEISAASNEQTTGIEQINSVIQALSHITRQNASASEEMAGSARELANQSEELKEVISYFNVGSLVTNR
jgi:methyl-accepting chemotaxis protein